MLGEDTLWREALYDVISQNKFIEGKNNKETLLKANTQVWMEV